MWLDKPSLLWSLSPKNDVNGPEHSNGPPLFHCANVHLANPKSTKANKPTTPSPRPPIFSFIFFFTMSVTLHTTHGDFKIEIFCESVPRTAEVRPIPFSVSLPNLPSRTS